MVTSVVTVGVMGQLGTARGWVTGMLLINMTGSVLGSTVALHGIIDVIYVLGLTYIVTMFALVVCR